MSKYFKKQEEIMTFKLTQDRSKNWIIGNDVVRIKCKNFDEIIEALTWIDDNKEAVGAPAPSQKVIRRNLVSKILTESKEPELVEEILEKIGATDHKRFGATCLALYRAKKIKRVKCQEGYAYFA